MVSFMPHARSVSLTSEAMLLPRCARRRGRDRPAAWIRCDPCPKDAAPPRKDRSRARGRGGTSGRPPREPRCRSTLDLAAESFERADDEVSRDVGAHHGAEARHAEPKLHRFGAHRPRIDDLVTLVHEHDGAARDFGDERSRSGGADLYVVIVDTALVTHGALGDQPQVARSARGATRLKRRSFGAGCSSSRR